MNQETIKQQKKCHVCDHMRDLAVAVMGMDASDIHMVSGERPAVRINGEIVKLEEFGRMMPEQVENLFRQMVTETEYSLFKERKELDFAYSISKVGRFRGNAMIQRGSISIVLRIVPFDVPHFDDLGLPPSIKQLGMQSRGLILVTGPTGSGKSTTLAALINEMNLNRRLNIVTIEDPIEFLHSQKKSIIRQREIGLDTQSFASALRHVLRHDPDVILVGEMRDTESIAIALSAVETGHLVLSTLHTQTAPLTVSRVVDVFESQKRELIRQQLANGLRAVLSQQLIKNRQGGRSVAVEMLYNTPAVASLIREDKLHQLYSVMQTGAAHEMQTMDTALIDLYRNGSISSQSVLDYCIHKKEVERQLNAFG